MSFNQVSRFMGQRMRINRAGTTTVPVRIVTMTLLCTVLVIVLESIATYNLSWVYRDVNAILLSDISIQKHQGVSRRELREQVHFAKCPRAFVGIFSRDDVAGVIHRQHYRTMFETVWNNDPRICSLPQFMEKVNNPHQQLKHDDCRLVYTFVVGAYKADDTSRPTEIVEDFGAPLDESIAKPIFVVDRVAHPYSDDVNRPDVTRLNIRENDHDGKSQTFLNFAYRHVLMLGENQGRQVQIEYCIKVDPDTFLSLHRYFLFAQTELLPAPFHRGILGGTVRDKAYSNRLPPQGTDPQPPEVELPRLESFWGNEFEGIHLYMSGQLYILSSDLVEFVLREVPFSRRRIGPGGYVVGEEGHDISSMAFHSPTPLHIITIGKSQRFWTNPVKTEHDWNILVTLERAFLTKAA